MVLISHRLAVLFSTIAIVGFVSPAFAENPDMDPPAEDPAQEKEPVKLVFTGLDSTGSDAAEVRAVSDFVQSRVADLGVYEVIGPAQIEAILGLEAQRQMLGCEGDAACITDIAGALASDRVLSGRLARIGSRTILTVFLLDAASVRMIGNADRTVHDEEGVDALLDAVPGMVRQVVSRDPLVTLPPEEEVPPKETAGPRPADPPGEEVGEETPPDDGWDGVRSREDLMRDPRNGLLVGVRAEWLRNYGPLGGVIIHGQGGPVGMGLGAVSVATLNPVFAGHGARAELRIMPIAWEMFAPYAGATGLIVYLPKANLLQWAPSMTAGVQFAWNMLVANLDVSWAFKEYSLTSEPAVSAPDTLLAGPSLGLTISLRL